MADEMVPSSIGSIVAGEVLAAEFLMTLADRDASVLEHPAFFHATGRPGSNVVRVPVLGYGHDTMAATTPGSETANTAFTDDAIDVTLANYVLRYTADDLARFMADGKIDPVRFAQYAGVNVAQTLIGLAANLTDGFSNVAGSSGVDAAWSDILTAKAFLYIAKAQGAMLGLLHGRQWADLEADALSLGVLPAQTNAAIVNSGLESYKGRYFGIDFFVHGAVPTADSGANRAGAIWTPGGLVWADAEYANDGDPNIVNLVRGQFERARRGTYSDTSYLIRAAMGVALGINAAGVTVKTDA